MTFRIANKFKRIFKRKKIMTSSLFSRNPWFLFFVSWSFFQMSNMTYVKYDSHKQSIRFKSGSSFSFSLFNGLVFTLPLYSLKIFLSEKTDGYVFVSISDSCDPLKLFIGQNITRPEIVLCWVSFVAVNIKGNQWLMYLLPVNNRRMSKYYSGDILYFGRFSLFP